VSLDLWSAFREAAAVETRRQRNLLISTEV
jgi:hypothetical protein